MKFRTIATLTALALAASLAACGQQSQQAADKAKAEAAKAAEATAAATRAAAATEAAAVATAEATTAEAAAVTTTAAAKTALIAELAPPTVLIISGTFLAIGKNLVSLLAFLEFFLRPRIVRVAVGVMLHGQLAVGLLDLVVGSVAVDAENFIKIAL